MRLFLNDKVEVLYGNLAVKSWLIATVVNMKSDQIKIHYDCDEDSDDDEWIDKESSRLAPLHTHTLPITNLPGISVGYNKVDAIHYECNKHEYILLCCHDAKSISRYDISASKWETYSNYPQEFSTKHAGKVCFDSKQLVLYMAYICDSKLRLALFDISLNSWVVKTWNVLTFNFTSYIKANLYFIPDEIEEIHLFIANNHYRITRYEFNEPLQIERTNDNCEKHLSPIIWCNKMQRLIGMADKSIYHCDINQKMQSQYIWKIDDQEQIDYNKEDIVNAHFILINKHILFIFMLVVSEIFCIDLLYGITYKVNKSIPAVINYTSTVAQTNNGYIHVIENQMTGIHLRISLFDIIPKELDGYYRKNICNPLVFGYISKMKKK
eukprot:294153_1